MHGTVTDVQRNFFPGKEDECYRFWYRNAISSPSTSSSPGTSPTSVAGPDSEKDSEKVSPDVTVADLGGGGGGGGG